jgi:hypothetical protein
MSLRYRASNEVNSMGQARWLTLTILESRTLLLLVYPSNIHATMYANPREP